MEIVTARDLSWIVAAVVLALVLAFLVMQLVD
jgi:hypothetical protein